MEQLQEIRTRIGKYHRKVNVALSSKNWFHNTPVNTTIHSPSLFHRGRVAIWDPRRKVNHQTEGMCRHVDQPRCAISKASPH